MIGLNYAVSSFADRRLILACSSPLEALAQQDSRTLAVRKHDRHRDSFIAGGHGNQGALLQVLEKAE